MSDAPVVVVASPDAATTAAAGETASAAAVEIATIEAERDVAIETIAAETARIGIEAASAEHEDDVEWLRGELAALHEQSAANASNVMALGTQLETVAGQVTELANGLSILASSTPQTPLEPVPETVPAEAPAEALASEADGRKASPEAKEQPPAARRNRRRWL